MILIDLSLALPAMRVSQQYMPRPGAEQYRSLEDALPLAIGGSGSVPVPILRNCFTNLDLSKGKAYLANRRSRDRPQRLRRNPA
ncbi:MAG: hypothetical protein IT556_04575 [Acetobacteraceae bacterium]|nr:hypothetical protein [Acetobacteraceae bacterium]